MEAEPRRYGFYSAKAEPLTGSVIYLNEAGKEVVVTGVCLHPDGREYNWADKVFVDVVVEYVREINKGTFNSIPTYNDR